MKTYDVIIIGAGVSGSVSARTLSEQKFNVLVIEKANAIGGSTSEKIDVVEVHGLKKYVDALNVKPVCITHRSKWHSPSRETFELKLIQEDCYFFKRGPAADSLESQLMKVAVEKGIELELGTTIIGIEKRGEFSKVIITNGKEKREILSKVVIGADSFNSMTAKLGEFPKISEIRKIVGYGFHAENLENIAQGVPEVYFNEKFVPGGYLYIAPISDTEATVVGVMDLEKIGMSRKSKELFHEFIEKDPNLKGKLSKKKVINEIRGYDIIAKPRKETVKEDILLVGNAAGVMDPLFAYGTKNAIVTGYIAGKITTEAIEANDFHLLRNYETEWREELEKSLKNGMRLRKIFDKMHNDDFDFVISSLNEIGSENIESKKLSPLIKIALLNPKASFSIVKKIF